MTAGGKWRNQIVTLLIDRPMTRREIHRALMPLYSTTEEAQIDTSLADMVYAGDLRRPFRGTYELRACIKSED